MIYKFNKLSIRNKALLLLSVISMTIVLPGCSKQAENPNKVKHELYKKMIKYDLKKPNEVFLLPGKAKEISGLTKLDQNRLLFLNDEDGDVFTYNLISKEITNKAKFWKDADFEGIELLGDKVYALQSDGDIISFDFNEGDPKKANKEETNLSVKNDTEGLGYDPVKDVLLIACKEKGDIDDKKVSGRVVYAYDYKEQKVIDKPVIQVRWEEIRDFLKLHSLDVFIKDSKKFKPSAISVNPVDNYYYVLSSTGKSLIVFDREGKIHLYYPISRKFLEQPEGICFDKNGDMYLSSEGEDKSPRILKFKMNTN